MNSCPICEPWASRRCLPILISCCLIRDVAGAGLSLKLWNFPRLFPRCQLKDPDLLDGSRKIFDITPIPCSLTETGHSLIDWLDFWGRGRSGGGFSGPQGIRSIWSSKLRSFASVAWTGSMICEWEQDHDGLTKSGRHVCVFLTLLPLCVTINRHCWYSCHGYPTHLLRFLWLGVIIRADPFLRASYGLWFVPSELDRAYPAKMVN